MLQDEAFGFVLVLCRCAACVMLLPGLGEAEPPALLRAGMSLALAVLLAPPLAPGLPALPDALPVLIRMVAAELLAGALLGWFARLVALALPAAGQVISLMTGLSSVLQPDPMLGAQSAVVGRLFNLAAPVLILATGLYALPLGALAHSYTILPAGTLPAVSDVAQVAVRATGESFSLGIRLAAPFLIAGTVWQVGLGMLSRLVPQLQVYIAALPGQVLGGLLLLSLIGGAILDAWLEAARAQLSGLGLP